MPDLSEGSIIAGCTVETVAGRGGMGVVYRATQLALRRPVALKAIAADLAQDADYRERFERESRLAASIDHPNIIPVYEAGEFDGTLYLIMRWVDGTDLRTLLRSSGRLEPARAVRVLRPVAAALSAAHRAGLVHRDIKPANVLIARGDTEDDEHVYLTDFGIARRTSGESAMTRTGMFVGTIDYTAPERIEGGKGDAASDVYSFGCMLYETLTGHIPYDRPSEVSKVFAHMNDPVPSARDEAPDVPEALDAIAAKAMAKDPADRFASAGELVAALGELLHTEERAQLTAATAVATPPVAPPRPESPPPAIEPRVQRSRRRAPLLIGALVVAAAVIAAVIALAGGGGGGGSPGTSLSVSGVAAGPTYQLGGAPSALSVGPGGNVWASLPDDGAVVRLGTAADRERRFAVGGHPGAIAAGMDGLWVADSSFGPLARLNLRTGRLEQAVQLTTAPSLLAVDLSDGSLWAVEPSGSAIHLSRSGVTLGAPVSVNPPPSAATAGEPNWLWAVNGRLVRVHTVADTYDAGANAVAVTLDQGVWTAHADGHVTRFDPRFLKVNTTIAPAPELDGISAVENTPAVWAISKQAKTLYRLSTASGAPVTGHATFASPPVAVAAINGGAWVATADGRVIEISG